MYIMHRSWSIDEKGASAIDTLRALRQQKTQDKIAAWRRRRNALDPILHFANTLQAAGEIKAASIDESDRIRPVCTVISNSDRKIVITCESAEREAGRSNELVHNISVEVVGRLKNPFRTYEGTVEADYEKVFRFVLEWIAELDAEKEALPLIDSRVSEPQ